MDHVFSLLATRRPRLRLSLLAAAALGFAFTLGGSAASETATTIKWKGCGITKKAFLKACAKAYTEETGTEIKVSGGGATKGIAAAGDGSADFGGTCRASIPGSDEEKLELEMSVVAWDALVPITFPDNPVQSLTTEQVKAILRGEITTWEQVGGSGGKIDVLVRDGKSSGVGHMVRRMIFQNDDAEFGDHVTRYKSSGPLEQQVEANPNAFGITGVSSARLRKVKILGVDGVEASPENIATGEYPYFRPLFLAYQPDLSDKERDFLAYILSPAGQAIVHEQGTVNLLDGWRLVEKYEFWSNTESIENFAAITQLAKEQAAR